MIVSPREESVVQGTRSVLLSEDMVEPWDEGIKKFAYSVARALGRMGEVLAINVARSGRMSSLVENVPGSRTFLDRTLAGKLRRFDPQIVLYVPSPSGTTASFARCAVLRRLAPGRPLGMVAAIPRRHPVFLRPMVKLLAPQVVFVPSYRSLLYLSRLGVRSELLPLGVDLDSFSPASGEEKKALRKRYGFDPDEKMVLHVGHMSRKRNLGALAVLKRSVPEARVVLVSSTSTPEDPFLKSELESAGVDVIRRVVEVVDFYRMSDCYVFPVEEEEGCIELPLSVLEAMACGVPVAATRFGGLPDFFADGSGVRYCSTPRELVRSVAEILEGDRPKRADMTRFAWSEIAASIVGSLIESDGGG